MKVHMDSRTNYKSTKKVYKYKSTHNSAIFWAIDSKFCMEVHMDCLTKWQSRKSTKVQNRKVKKYKNAKNANMQKNPKNGKM